MSVFVDEDLCSGCGECVDICPSGVISLNVMGVAVVREEDCEDCMACLGACPSEAISER